MNQPGGNPDPIPEEDSEDLTDSEISRAIQTKGVQTIIEVLGAFCGSCPKCGLGMSVGGHALRRRRPNLFWRTMLSCSAGHDEQVTFQVNWMKESGS